jgi:transketolase
VEGIAAAVSATGNRLVTAEDHWPEGGLGEAVLSELALAGTEVKAVKLAVSRMPTSGKPAELLAAAGIDAEHIADAVRGLVSGDS